MKILWLSAKVLSESDDGATGTWLQAMAQRLVETRQVELGNIAEGQVKSCSRRDYGPIRQWIMPKGSQFGRRSGLLSPKSVSMVTELIEKFSPDLIHVWGTENNWGLFTARNPMRFPVLLEIQGLRGVISRVFHGGLSFREQLACVGPKELILRSSIGKERRKFQDWGSIDQEIISKHRFIASHSDWAVAQVKAINNDATIFRNERMLRKHFYEQPPWKFPENPVIFCSAAYPSPFKGLHVAVRSLALLKERFPNIQMRIAGTHQRPGFRQEGYIAWINREIHRLNIEANIVWLGPISGLKVVQELSNCSVFVLPTFIESYCVALAEAMVLGVPTAVSFNGGTSYLASDNETALFFPPGDETMCAYQLEQLLTNPALAEKMSSRARAIALARNDPDRIVKRQVEIYQSVIAETGLSDNKKRNDHANDGINQPNPIAGAAFKSNFISGVPEKPVVHYEHDELADHLKM